MEAITVGSRFTVSLQINPAITVQGVEVAPSADAATRTRRVKIALENPPGTVRLGTTITAELEGPDLTAIMVPETAVLQKDGKPHVRRCGQGRGAPGADHRVPPSGAICPSQAA